MLYGESIAAECQIVNRNNVTIVLSGDSPHPNRKGAYSITLKIQSDSQENIIKSFLTRSQGWKSTPGNWKTNMGWGNGAVLANFSANGTGVMTHAGEIPLQFNWTLVSPFRNDVKITATNLNSMFPETDYYLSHETSWWWGTEFMCSFYLYDNKIWLKRVDEGQGYTAYLN